MCQRRWIDMLSDYECEIKYHPGKANVVADALSRKERLKPSRVRAMSITIHFGLKTKILEAQGEASKDLKALAELLRGLETHVSTCSVVKTKHQKPSRLLQQPKLLEWKWEKITMDLVTKLPRSSDGYDKIWVIVDRLTKSAYFLPIREDYKTKKLARIYINEIVARHGVPVSIISNRDAYHLEIDGQSERTIQTLEDMLRACAMDFGGSWDTHLPLTEVVESQLIGPKIVQETTEKIILIKERLKTARNCQKSYADKRRKPIEFKVGDRVLLKVSPWKGVVRFGNKGKLELSCVHDTFHVSNLKKCLAEPDVQVPLDEIEIDENLYFVEEPIEIVERDVKKLK
nr:reverse transcriptase domain-containing protein [Tanacetum cinerariifolium]